MEPNYFIEYQGQAVELPLGETVIGRDTNCRLRFNDPKVSRKHMRLVRREDELFVEDLKSSNGTLLNGRPVTVPMRLKDGDTLQVGAVELVLRIVDAEGELSDTFTRPALPTLDVSTGVPRAPTHGHLETVKDDAAPRATEPMKAVSIQDAKQRCPRCGSAVTDTEDSCASCGFEWGGFRSTSHTDVRSAERKGIARRRHERTAVALQLVYVSEALEIEAITLDLSTSGVFVCTEVLDPVGTRCQLTLLVDGGPPLQIGGIVRRVVTHDESGRRESGLGVEFVNVGDTERDWLATVIAKQIAAGAPSS